MKKITSIIWTIALLAVIFSCNISNSGSKFLGNWQSDKYAMTITKEGETFIINVQKTSGWEGLQGKHTAKLEGKNLKVDISFLGELVLSDDGGKIYWASDEWKKVN